MIDVLRSNLRRPATSGLFLILLITHIVALGLFLSSAVSAQAKQRHALVIGIGDYKEKKSGLSNLAAPRHDAMILKSVLEGLPNPFKVQVLINSDVQDKAVFNTEFEAFLDQIQPGDEVVFYFSGHGYHSDKSGNHFLLQDSKSGSVFVRSLPQAERRELASDAQRTTRYADWISEVALSELEIEQRILERSPGVLVIIADACRTNLRGTKGFVPVGTGVKLPSNSKEGVFRIYSALAGQESLDSTDPIDPTNWTGRVEDAYEAEQKSSTKNKSKGRKKKRPKNSLFTQVLLSHLDIPGLEISVLAKIVRNDVRQRARDLGREQIPDFQENPNGNAFYFKPAALGDVSLAMLCHFARAEIKSLRDALLSGGGSSRDVLEQKLQRLSRCGQETTREIQLLLNLEAQGTGALAATEKFAAPRFDLNNPFAVCDFRASSPFDYDRPGGIAGTELKKLAVQALANPANRKEIETQIIDATTACETAITKRPRVARYYFNAARGYYTLSLLTNAVLHKTDLLARASAGLKAATELGYAAAYNDLALMIQNGEYHEIVDGRAQRQPIDRGKAADLLQRGANLNHVLAQYNVGMAHLRGDFGYDLAARDNKRRDVNAFDFLSRAAQAGHVPAMIEAAKLLYDGRGLELPDDAKRGRALQLLRIAANQGSWEAMYWLARGHYLDWKIRGKSGSDMRALLWYARAAEAGDARSQEALADMLSNGFGVPVPQPEAAARYWRLSADAGSRSSQFILANLLRRGKIRFRTTVDSGPDGGAREIRELYESAFAKGDPAAGLELAKLYRKGFPKGKGSEALPVSPQEAVNWLHQTIDLVRRAKPSSDEANPKVAVQAAFMLMQMYDAGEAVSRGGRQLIREDEIKLLRQTWGDGTKSIYLNIKGLFKAVRRKYRRRLLNCGPVDTSEFWVLIWNWQRKAPPTGIQFDWWERKHRCKETVLREIRDYNRRNPKKKRKIPKDSEIGITRRLRSAISNVHKKWLRDYKRKPETAETFTNRMVKIANR